MLDNSQILHVDPADPARESVDAAFAAVGATVDGVSDAAAAGSALAESSYDCVVAGDVVDPLALLDDADAPVVCYVDADASFAGRAVAAGAAEFVPKADGVETLVERVSELLDDALDRVRFESDLREERDRFAALFENVPNPVVSVRDDGDGPTFVAVNRAFERVFGYDEKQVVGEPVTEVIIPADRRSETGSIAARAAEGNTVKREVTRRTISGHREFLITVVPVDRDAENPDMYAIYTDITERKQRRKRVEVLNRVLRHDLRNGMNIVRGYAESLRDEVPAERREAIDAIAERTTELADLAEKTRAVQRTLGDARGTGPVDAAEAVDDAVEQVRQEYPDADVECSVPERALASVDTLFRTAVRQVVQNAVIHNDRPTPSVDVAVRDDGDSVAVAVADDGPGIPTAERELLGDDREITQLRHASGLGLWLVNWVVEQAGGTLSFDDNDPRGTVVTLRVPLAYADADASDRKRPNEGDENG